jgi:holo-[acyl-carrier protein] synthase|tara:strand:- start:921 stop:1289 length:369 start_codon:yes stop_codon:yes gene_type:complete
MIYTGIDIIEINRIVDVKKRFNKRFLKKIYTDQEILYCKDRGPQLASRFAAKEAMMKALGTGIRGIPWKSIEVTRERGKAPKILLHGAAKKKAKELKIHNIALSLSHSKKFAVASVIVETHT